MYDPMAEAMRALRNGETRAAKHLAAGKPEKARKALMRGLVTAARWLDGSHPKLQG